MLEGKVVSLRAIEREDVPRLHELLETDMDVMTRASDRPPRPTSLVESISFYEELSKRDNPPMWFVIEVNGEVIGECGLHRIDHYQGTCHLGIALGKAYWSQGYGRDAVRTLVDFAFHHLRMRKVSLEVLADDERAVRAYQAVGFEQEGLSARRTGSTEQCTTFSGWRYSVLIGRVRHRNSFVSSRTASPLLATETLGWPATPPSSKGGCLPSNTCSDSVSPSVRRTTGV